MGSPATAPLPCPGDAWKDAGKRAAVAWLWASCPGPAERGGVGRGVSPAPVPGGRRLCSPCREKIYSLQELGGYREKVVPHFQRMLPAAPEVGWLLGGPGSSRLKKPSKGQLWGRVRGRGQRELLRSETPPLLPTQAQSRFWDPGPGEGLLLHCVIHELGLLRACLAAPPGGLMSPVKMAMIH